MRSRGNKINIVTGALETEAIQLKITLLLVNKLEFYSRIFIVKSYLTVYVRNIVDKLEEIGNNDDSIERSSDDNSE